MDETDRQGEPDVRFDFGHEPGAPKRARHALDPLFDNDPEDPIAEAVRLTASELVSNVVQHTDDGGTMQAWDPKPDIPLRLEVEDNDRTLPEVPAHAREVGGRGLEIVDGVSDEWGVDPTGEGKIVWAEFNRPHTDHPHTDE